MSDTVALLAVLAAVSTTATLGADARPSAIRLTPAPASLGRACATAAQRLHTVVYCPSRTPAGWSLASSCISCDRLRLFSATGWFPAPPGYVGQPGEPTGHLNIWAASPYALHQGYVGCPGARNSWKGRIAGLDTTWIACPSGSTLDSGHVVVRWSAGGWVHGLSLHGNTSTNRRLLAAMARHLRRFRG